MSRRDLYFSGDDVLRILDSLVKNVHLELDTLMLDTCSGKSENLEQVQKLSIQRGTLERVKSVFEFEIEQKEDSRNEQHKQKRSA